MGVKWGEGGGEGFKTGNPYCNLGQNRSNEGGGGGGPKLYTSLSSFLFLYIIILFFYKTRRTFHTPLPPPPLPPALNSSCFVIVFLCTHLNSFYNYAFCLVFLRLHKLKFRIERI